MLSCVKPASLQQVLDFAGGAAGRVRRGAGAAGLGCDGDAPAGCEPPAQLGEPFGRRGPEPEGVDGEDGVEGAVDSGRKLIGRCIDQGDPPGPDGGGVAPGRLPEHHAGMVDAVHVTRAGADQFRDRHAGAEADLKDLVGGPHIEQRDHPAVALPVGRAVGEHPAGHAPGRAPGMMALADDVAVQGAHDGDPGTRDPVLDGGGHCPPHCPCHASLMSCSHGRQSTPSSAPEVNTPGGLLTIGELARRAGVTASALRYYEELGLLPAPARISGQRRYPESAARLVAAILLYSDAGFTLAEQKALLAPAPARPATGDSSCSASSRNSTSRSPGRRPPAMPSATVCAAPTKTSRNAPTSTPASPPGSPASHCHNPTGSCTANGPARTWPARPASRCSARRCRGRSGAIITRG